MIDYNDETQFGNLYGGELIDLNTLPPPPPVIYLDLDDEDSQWDEMQIAAESQVRKARTEARQHREGRRAY